MLVNCIIWLSDYKFQYFNRFFSRAWNSYNRENSCPDYPRVRVVPCTSSFNQRDCRFKWEKTNDFNRRGSKWVEVKAEQEGREKKRGWSRNGLIGKLNGRRRVCISRWNYFLGVLFHADALSVVEHSLTDPVHIRDGLLTLFILFLMLLAEWFDVFTIACIWSFSHAARC